MKAIVDVQGFKTDSNEFILKELAMQCGNHVIVLLIKPPYPFYSLTKTERRQVAWIENNRNVFWDDGFIPYSNYKNHIVNFFKNKRIIFVKGLEKANWVRVMLQSVLNVGNEYLDVINIEDFGCPNLQTLCESYKECPEIYNCIYHSNYCALKNVNCIMKWSSENKIL